MNFLAHIYLSGPSEEIMTGNFIGDAIKGNAFNHYPEKIKKGILLHRKIDHFTDNNTIVTLSKNKLRKLYGKYAGIVVDIFYDHFLSVNWDKYSHTNREDFIKYAYKILLSKNTYIPAKVTRFLPYMVLFDWLGSYINIESIRMVLNGMSKRTSLPNHSNEAIEILKKSYHLFDNEFNIFFPQIINFAENELN